MTLLHVTHKRARVTGKMGGTAEDIRPYARIGIGTFFCS